MTESLNFRFQDFATVRVVMKENETFWVLKDLCEILQLSNVTMAIEDFEDDERGSVKLNTSGGLQEMLAVSEAGLYHLIFKSQKPEAKEFRRWVTHEVLPAIRRQGYYSTPKGMAACKAAQRETARLLSKQVHAVAQVDSIAANLKNIVANLEDYRKALSEELYKVVEQGGANNLVLTGEPYAPCIRIGEPDED